MKRRLFLSAALALSLASAGYADGHAQYRGTLKLGWGTLDTSDFRRHTGTISVPHPFAETLTTLSKDGQPKGLLAESWEVSEDGLTYTFKTHEGVKFHNGRDLTAADVMANFERIRNEVSRGWLTTAMNQVEGFSTPDDFTIEVKLTAPFAPFLNLIAEAWILAPESEGWDDNITKPIGTGPFMFDEWTPPLTLKGAKFEDYWMEGKPYVDAIEFDLRDVADRSLGLRAGDYHAASIPLNKLAAVEKAEDAYVEFRGDTGWTFWSFNTKNPKPPFGKVRVREAITYAMDKAILLKIAAGEYGIRNELKDFTICFNTSAHRVDGGVAFAWIEQ